jgi:hypothetical protein
METDELNMSIELDRGRDAIHRRDAMNRVDYRGSG